jgi:hypothetical protein
MKKSHKDKTMLASIAVIIAIAAICCLCVGNSSAYERMRGPEYFDRSFDPSLVEVVVPSGKHIVDLHSCENLAQVRFPAKVDWMLLDLSGCYKLKQITLPPNVTVLELNTCTALEELDLPGGSRPYKFVSVMGCKNLGVIKVPRGFDRAVLGDMLLCGSNVPGGTQIIEKP